MFKPFSVKCFAIVICAMACVPLAASSNVLFVPSVPGEVHLDGVLDEPIWQQAETLTLDYVTAPFENTAPPVTTLVRVFEDGETLYLAFDAQDPNPQAISAFFRDRDKIWSDDMVGVKLDTFNNSRLAHQFFVNPLGIQGDAVENEMTGQESDNWDGIWQSAGRITETGYQVEMAIPLRILNFEESDQRKRWRAEFLRFYPRTDRLRISNLPRDRDNACELCQMGEIEGFADARQGKNLAVIPTLVVGRARTRDLEAGFDWDYSDSQEVGLDLQWGISPEVSLQATLNPDFSQVESDVAQLSINNTFALFFSEKRPFFLENADYFSTNYNLVYTRNISAPDVGAKITGQVNNHTFGLFASNDESTRFVVPGNLGSAIAEVEDESTNVALRYRYDVSDDLSVGTLATLRDASGYHNYVAAVDAKYQITPQDSLRVQLVGSDTAYPVNLAQEFADENRETYARLRKDDSFSDVTYRINYLHDERNWFARADRYARGEDFRADLGFMSIADRTTDVIGGGYRWFNENSWWNRIQLSGDWDISHNDAGELLEKESQMWLGLNGKWQAFYEFGVTQRERVGLRQDPRNLAIAGNTTLFEETQYQFFVELQPSSALYYNTFIRYGDHIDFANNRLGKQLLIEPRVDWSIGPHLRLDVRHTYQDFDVDGESLFTANLTDARLTYQFDQRQFLRLILVYSDIERNQANYIDDITERSHSLSTQLLYSYKVNPLTKLFIGYSDAAFKDDVVTSLRTAEASVFMKVSYAWLN